LCDEYKNDDEEKHFWNVFFKISPLNISRPHD